MKQRDVIQGSVVLGTAALVAPYRTVRSCTAPAARPDALRLDTGSRFIRGDGGRAPPR